MRRHAAKNSFDSVIRQKYYHDLARRPADLKQNDYVYVYNHNINRNLSRKLQPVWTGPHLISKVKYDDERPIAIEIIDLERLQTRRVSFKDVKEAYVDRDTYDIETLPGHLLMKYIITFHESEADEDTNSIIVPADYDPTAELFGTESIEQVE